MIAMKIKVYGMPFSLIGLFARVGIALLAVLIISYLGFWLLLGEWPQFN